MNRYPLWKYLLIIVVLLVGTIYALPNLYGEDPALQISGTRRAEVDESVVRSVTASLEKAGIAVKRADLDAGRILVRFDDTETQLKAVDFVKATLGNDYVVALNLAPSTPAWLQSLNAQPMYLGLDLRGGVHFLLEVDMGAAFKQALESYANDFRTLLREAKLRYTVLRPEASSVRIEFREQQDADAARSAIKKDFPALVVEPLDEAGKTGLRVRPPEQEVREIQDFALQQNILTLRNRVNELGVAEPVIQQQGSQRIVVQLPGVQDTAQAKRILGATATLEYRAVDIEHDVERAVAGKVPAGSRLYYERDGTPVLLKKAVIATGNQIINARSGFDPQSGSPMVSVTLDAKGARSMLKFTKESVGKPMAVVFIENRTETALVDGVPV
ncbi:MAG TPA: protein translocase subunit SecD, partial [Gammaproteobacteria bacterium]|nr:protein translocase subunit SecD [Gammaproteobacteria bacterium]